MKKISARLRNQVYNSDASGEQAAPMQRPVPMLGSQWDVALSEYVDAKKAELSFKGAEYYETHSKLLTRWAKEMNIGLFAFDKKHLDDYVNYRKTRVSEETTRKDRVVAKNYFAFLKHRRFIPVDRLADYQVKSAKARKKIAPGIEVLQTFLEAIERYYDPHENSRIRFMATAERKFYCARLRAIVYVCISSATRIDETLEICLKDLPTLSDVARNKNGLMKKKLAALIAPAVSSDSDRMITLREEITKDGETRRVPICDTCCWALREYLFLRNKSFSTDPDELVFAANTGEPGDPAAKCDYHDLLRAIHNIQRFAGIEKHLTFHDLRRHTLSSIANLNLYQAQLLGGHSNPNTTLTYVTEDRSALVKAHVEAAPLEKVMVSKNAIRMRSARARGRLAR